MRFRPASMRAASLGFAVALLAAACSSGGGGNTSAPTAAPSLSASGVAAPKTGGQITVIESAGYSGTWPVGLDPMTNVQGAAVQDFMEAIYGQLFMLGPNGQIQPDLATGYSFSPDAKTVTITLRQGVTFSDGTPFNAQAVYDNWMRLFSPAAVKAGTEPPWLIAHSNPKVPTSPPAKGAIQVTGPYTIVVHQIQSNAAFINQLFDSLPMWIASPTAYGKVSEQQFAKFPVGAGPFTVVQDVYSNTLVLKKNPHYWQPGRPYLDQITFKTVGSDEAAIETMLAGQANVYEDLGVPALIKEAQQHFQVVDQPGTSPYDLQLNTAVKPFNNPKARQAIYAATNFAPILKNIFGNRYPVTESFTGPGGICYEPTVPGYQGYDPALAKQLVKESGLDKVTINLGTISTYAVAVQTTEALKSEWAQVGIKANIQSYQLTALVQAFEANGGKSWQSMVQTAGAFDPAAGVGVGFRFSSMSPISGVHDPRLDKMLTNAMASPDLNTRCGFYHQAAAYIAKNYYGPFYFTLNATNVSSHGIAGPGLTSPLPSVAVVPTIPWEDVYYNPPSS